ncbi:MAG: hypothetical protein NTV72_00035 [Candidatus Taylorbacteria bacterium]|nr:hypothetical protein [Candidatus Taylorbacteria bacterium]
MEIRKVDEVILHVDLDEAGTWMLVKKFGKSCFEINENPKFTFASIPEKMGADHWSSLNTLVLGSGGDVFDEHRNGDDARETDPDGTKLCSMVKAVRHLGIIEDPVILDIAEEIRYYDNERGCPKTHLGTLIKMFKNKQLTTKCSDTVTLRIALNWAVEMVEVVHRAMANPTEAILKNHMPEFPTFVGKIIREELSDEFTDECIVNKVLGIIKNDSQKHDVLILENIFRCLWQTADGNTSREITREVKDYVIFALRLIYWDQLDFQTFRREQEALRKAQNSHWFKISGWKERGHTQCRQFQVQAVALQTSNRHAHSVLMSLGAQLTIVMNETGHVTIMGNVQAIEILGDGFVSLAAMLRFSEVPQADKEKAVWSSLCVRGNCQYAPKWHLDEADRLFISNGTDNFKGVPKTNLTLPEIVRISRDAFNPNNVQIWKGRNHVPAEREEIENELASLKIEILDEARRSQ